MRSEWAYYEAKIPAAECQAIIDKVLVKELETGTIGHTTTTTVNREIRDSEIAWLDRVDPEFQDIFRVLDYCVDEANDEFFGIDYNRQGARSLQFTVYRAGGREGNHFYDVHQDTPLFSGERPTQRKLSVSVQLSEPDAYEGGDLFMEKVNAPPPRDAIRKRGSIIIFPSLILHGVTPVTRGTRYSLVGWYVGPNWK